MVKCTSPTYRGTSAALFQPQDEASHGEMYISNYCFMYYVVFYIRSQARSLFFYSIAL